jgi:DNA topoisomerase-1
LSGKIRTEPMAENLLIVESPTKARTIKKYLGSDFKVMSSMGHIKDLPANRLGVDIAKDFKPEYVTIKGKAKIQRQIKEAGKDTKTIYLAPDPDREGEAIAWHLAGDLRGKNKNIHRVIFNELTPRAIKEGVTSPHDLNRNRFEAQQARRILDRLVGYQISPLLWKKVRQGLSAGRVQSVAVKIVCDREREIQAFIPQEYWSLTAYLLGENPPAFEATLFTMNGRKIDLRTRQDVDEAISLVKDRPFKVKGISCKDRIKNPPPPFSTSLLQQEAFRKLGFTAKKTMGVAQGLYEGIELGKKGQVGLITYMRTDSFRLAKEAVDEVRELIANSFGPNYLPENPNIFRSKKGAQEAHEAIRPTSVKNNPQEIAHYLSKEQLELYTLIWRRFVACQMKPAIMKETLVEIESGPAIFRATGSILTFPGFTRLYEEGKDDEGKEKKAEHLLPSLRKDEILNLKKLEPKQHSTKPPPRYTEATLVKELEANGIGRPSTYAPTMATIHNKEYVAIERQHFKPTELGFLVSDLLVENFPDILNAAFTAQMEDKLDKIENGELKWIDLLHEFYKTFSQDLTKAQKEMKKGIATDMSCPQCNRHMMIKSGKNGLFLACTGFPECTYTANFHRDEKGKIIIEEKGVVEQGGEQCEICGRPMVVKRGPYGEFLGCSGYPECKNTKPKAKKSIGVPCPEQDCNGELVERYTKKGKRFYACNQYPRCHFLLWDKPVNEACPICNTPILVEKQTKGSRSFLGCRKKDCGFKKDLP